MSPRKTSRGQETALFTALPNAYPWRVATNAAQKKRSRRRLLELACICFAVVQIGWFLFPESQVLMRAEYNLQDRLVAAGGARKLDADFVLVAIDDGSLKLDQLFPEDLDASASLRKMEASGFPWPRSVYADAIERLLAAGAKVVLVDLILNKEGAEDAALRKTLDAHPDRIVLGMNFTLDNVTPDHPELAILVPTVPAPSLIDAPTRDPRVGFVNFKPSDFDNVVRAAPYGMDRPEGHFNSLGAAALRLIGLGDRIPASGRSFPFRYADTASIPTYPFYTLFVEPFWKQTLRDGEVFRDKIVVIGPTATVLHDFHQTPNGLLAGPLLHINALSAALHGDFYQRAPSAVRLLAVIAAAALALATTTALRHPLVALGAVVGACAAYIVAVHLAATFADYVFPVVQPGLVFLMAGVACISWNFAQARRDSSRMRSMLDRYVSRNLVREVLDNRENFLEKLGGTRQPMTVFFSDVRGFTSFAEKEDAHAIVGQLNEYLGEMVGIIFRHHGTVDKFMGDGIMAVWGNVVSEGPARDAVRSISAALEMLDRLQTLNATWTARGLTPFAIGIGLHHGEAVFGNIGSAEKMEPTVIGDTVNLASRVEGLTKKYGVTLCITQPLAELIADQFLLRSVDLVQVVGKSRPVEIFTVMGPRAMLIPDWLRRYEAAIADFRARRFAEAATELRALCDELHDGDKLCTIYRERAEHFLADPPPDDWTGTEIATSK